MNLTEVQKKFRSTLDHLHQELSGLRTGRASPALIETIRVDSYGVLTPLKQLASISVSDPRSLVIEAWDPLILKNIEKAIQQSDLGVNPTNEGNRLRIVLPPLTEERRLDMTKIAKQKAESSRITIRALREEYINDVRRNEKNGELSEDESSNQKKELQKLVDSMNKEIEEMLQEKIKEIQSIT